jgi:hypothetical protein
LSIFAFYPLSEVLERLDLQFRRVPEQGNIGSSDNVNGREKTTAWGEELEGSQGHEYMD